MLQRLLTVSVLAVLCCGHADAKPARHWFTDWKWWVGEAVIGAAITADSHSTASHRPGPVEGNAFLGPHPSNQKIAGISLLNFGIQTACHAGAWHYTHHVPLKDGTGYAEDRLGWRILGYTAIPAEVAIISGRAAARNYTLK